MPYWMTNDKHGVMPLYDMGAVEQAKVHGWKLLNEGREPLYVDRSEPETKELTAEPVKRKPGRPRKGE